MQKIIREYFKNQLVEKAKRNGCILRYIEATKIKPRRANHLNRPIINKENETWGYGVPSD